MQAKINGELFIIPNNGSRIHRTKPGNGYLVVSGDRVGFSEIGFADALKAIRDRDPLRCGQVIKL